MPSLRGRAARTPPLPFLLSLLLAASFAGCGQPDRPTSIFLTVEIAGSDGGAGGGDGGGGSDGGADGGGDGAATTLDELRVSLYGDRAAIFVDKRLPEAGPLTPLGPRTLGTATIYLPDDAASARFDVRGMTAGQARLRGTKRTSVTRNRQIAVTIVLEAQPLPDVDGDGVPDAIDDCPAIANASQADANGDGTGDACAPATDARRGDAATDKGTGAADAGPTDAPGASDTLALTDAASDAGKADAAAAGTLLVAPLTFRTPVDLTVEGTIDWAHWGASNVISFDHRATSSRRISDVSPHGQFRYNNAVTTYAWSDGAPTASASTATGVYTLGSAASFTVTVPADTTPSTVRLYLGAGYVDAKLTASLSDGSAAPATYATTGRAGTGDYALPVEIRFRAASAGQTLTLVWTPASGGGNVSINSATLF